MTTFTINILINRSVDMVNKALMNPDNFPFWQTYLIKFEIVKGEPGKIGSIGRLHYFQKGRSYIMEDKLIYCEPGEKYVSEVTGEVLTARVETVLVPLDNKTKMILKWSGRGEKFFFKILLPLLLRKMIDQSKKELELFKELVETRGVDFRK